MKKKIILLVYAFSPFLRSLPPATEIKGRPKRERRPAKEISAAENSIIAAR